MYIQNPENEKLNQEAKRFGRDTKTARQYKRLLRVPDAEKADEWSWNWHGPERGIFLRRRSKR